MEEKERRMLNFVVSVEEAVRIDSAAREGGLSRSDYIRKRLLAPEPAESNTGVNVPLSRDPIVLLQQALYWLQRIISAQYQIACVSGVLTREQAESIGAHTIEMGTGYIANLEAKLAKASERIAAAQAAVTKPTE
jgi:hypothetical protein